jgi:hypothetical protein
VLFTGVKDSSREQCKISAFTVAWPMAIVKSTKLSEIGVNFVALKSVFSKEWC